MKTIKGPGIFLAQFIGSQAPFNTLEGLAQWAAGLGYQALQIPCNHPAIFDVERAAASQTYCDEVSGKLAEHGLAIGELSTHLEGQLVAVHPAYDTAFDAFAPAALRGNPQARQQWAVEKVRQAAVASARLGLKAHATFSGALAWPYFYPWPPHNQPLLDEAFDELARRQLQLPVVLQRLELPLLIVMARGVLQFRAKDGCRHFIQQLFIVFAQRYCRQQAIALHAQRTGFINGVRAALDAVHQARRDRHSGDADEGSQQNDQRELIHQRQRRKKTFQHGVRGS